MHKEELQNLLNLRMQILALGEAADPPWWATRFLTPTGLSFLRRIYPRSAMAAAAKAAMVAARDAHDAAIGRIGAFHLFRLPGQLEIALDEHLMGVGADLAQTLEPVLAKKAELVARLKENAASGVQPQSGAVRAGVASGIAGRDMIGKVAALYLGAVERGQQVYPYFEA